MNKSNALEMGVYSFMPEVEVDLEESEEYVETSYGSVKVVIFGERTGHPIVTFHDIGMNSDINFNNFFAFQAPAKLMNRFCVYNINAPGQEFGAKRLPSNYVYPTMDGLARIVGEVVAHFCIKSFIGIGMGAGANIFLRYALAHPHTVDLLVLINPIVQKAGWIEWFYQKFNLSSLRSGKMTQFTVDYFLWHYFGSSMEECNPDIVQQYKAYFYSHQNPWNLALFTESFLNRNEVHLKAVKTSAHLLNVPTLLVVGINSAFVDESVYVNSQMDPKTTEWVKISDSSGLVLEDRPAEVTQAFLFFLQGFGLCCDLNVSEKICLLKGELQEIKTCITQGFEKVDEIG